MSAYGSIYSNVKDYKAENRTQVGIEYEGKKIALASI